MGESSGVAFGTILAAALATTSGCVDGPSDIPTSTIRGNLVAIESSPDGRGSSSPAAVEGVHVSIEGTSFSAVTGPRGEFVIESPFSGLGALVFRREANDFVAWLGVDVPPGGTVTLHDGRCSPERKLCRTESTEIERPARASEGGGARESWAATGTTHAVQRLVSLFASKPSDRAAPSPK